MNQIKEMDAEAEQEEEMEEATAEEVLAIVKARLK